MQPHDTSLRDRLAGMADEAGPPAFTAQTMITRVRRRRLRAILSAAAGTTMLVLGVTAFIQSGTHTARSPMADPPAPGGPAQPGASATPSSTAYRCGDLLTLSTTTGGYGGLGMHISGQSRYKAGPGAVITVTFTSPTPVHVTASPPHLFQVLYLRDGVIVGGGPMLNKPGDDTPQGIDAIGQGFDVTPEHPAVLSLGPRDTLCPSLTWEKVWSQPGRYEVAVVQGWAESTVPGQMTLGIPLPLTTTMLADGQVLTG